MDLAELNKISHRRFNILNRTWILVSPHRTKRPWQGKEEEAAGDKLKEYDPDCYLCPGNVRANGEKNPVYEGTYVFQNDFAALMPEVQPLQVDEGGLFVARAEDGLCKVVCFSPRHDLTLARMAEGDIQRVVEVWARQYDELINKAFVNAVTIFENRGAIMGCSNPHPHGQIWATRSNPEELAREINSFGAYEGGECLLCDYLAAELKHGGRVVCQNDHFACLVPFWAFWPYETLVVSKRCLHNVTELAAEEQAGLAAIMKQITVKYDNLFKVSFPYSMGLHQTGIKGQDGPPFHFHLHYYPPLLRSATVKKFRVGFEMLGEPQRDITAEYSAEVLRELSTVHYTEG